MLQINFSKNKQRNKKNKNKTSSQNKPLKYTQMNKKWKLIFKISLHDTL